MPRYGSTMKWKPVVIRGILLPFEVSDIGRVRSIDRPDAIGRRRKGKLISPQIVAGGYVQVTIKHNFITYHPLAHTLVAFAFLPPPPSEYGRHKIAINHINGVKTDNRPNNLEWVTYRQNSEHASRAGLMLIGENNPNSRMTEIDVRKMRKLHADGVAIRKLARDFGYSRFAIKLACDRITWKHIKD